MEFQTEPTEFGGARTRHPKVLIIKLAKDELFRTDATTNMVGKLVDLAALRGLGPMVSKMRVHWEADGCTAAFSGKVTIAWSISGKTWSNPVAIFGAQTGNAHTKGAWYSDDTNFGILMRAAIETGNSSGTQPENGRVTAYLEVELKS